MTDNRIDPEAFELVHEVASRRWAPPSGVADLGGVPHRFSPELDAEGVWTGAHLATPMSGAGARRVGLFIRRREPSIPTRQAEPGAFEVRWHEWPPYARIHRFGTRDRFGIDVMLEPDPMFGFAQADGRVLFGRLRLWLAGHEVGDFGESCMIGVPATELVELRDRLGNLWDPTLDGLTDERIYDFLDWLCFAAHRGAARAQGWDEADWQAHSAESAGRNWFHFHPMSSEIFDDCKLFIVRPSPTELLALFSFYPQVQHVHACRFSITDFVAAATACADWIAAREQELLP